MNALGKQVKNKEKEQAKVDRLRASLATKESERNTLEERLNVAKPLDDLKERESELQREKEKQQDIIQSEDSPGALRQKSRRRQSELNEELARLQTQIA